MVKCNRGCGATDLRWKVVNGSYKLFNYNDLLHICNDGTQASEKAQRKATAVILADLGLKEPASIPEANDKPLRLMYLKRKLYGRQLVVILKRCLLFQVLQLV